MLPHAPKANVSFSQTFLFSRFWIQFLMHSCKRISNWPFWFARYREIGGTWCNATNKMQCKKTKIVKHQLDVKVIELKICSWHVWQQSVSPCIEINLMCVSKSNCQTMCQFTSSHVQSLCCGSRQMLQNGWFNHES